MIGACGSLILSRGRSLAREGAEGGGGGVATAEGLYVTVALSGEVSGPLAEDVEVAADGGEVSEESREVRSGGAGGSSWYIHSIQYYRSVAGSHE